MSSNIPQRVSRRAAEGWHNRLLTNTTERRPCQRAERFPLNAYKHILQTLNNYWISISIGSSGVFLPAIIAAMTANNSRVTVNTMGA